METLLTFLVAGGITLFFVRKYLKTLVSKSNGSLNKPASTVQQRPCPRCGKLMEYGAAFCPHCGAAIAMWTVHLAMEQSAKPEGAPAGHPRPVINASLCIGCASCVHACPETGTLEMSAGKAILAHPERCTGQAKCSEVCPTQAITLSFGGVLQTLRVPLVKANYETNIPGVFVVGELCGMGLIKTAINEGKIVIDNIRGLVVQSPPIPEAYDVAIVGAGPAGLSATLTAQQYGLRYVTLEQGEIASTIRQYPRQKFLMAEPIEMPLYGALYVGDGSKEALLAVWETIIKNTGVQINTNEKVEAVERNSNGFHVITLKREYHARYVVLAAGKRGTPRKLGVEGDDLAKVSYRLIEVESYTDKDLLVVGGGDSAIEAALALSRSGANRVTLSYRGDAFQRARDRNREQLTKATDEGRIRILLNSHVTRIGKTMVNICAGDDEFFLPNDFVFAMLGGESPEQFLQKMGIEIVEKAIGER
jgi:putative YpdA family bacillithiol system oxidoreductase